MKKFKIIILRNELDGDHNPWIRACESYRDEVDYRVVNLTSSDWLEEIRKQPADILLAKPGGLTAPFKQLYDERIYILDSTFGYKIFPSPAEIYIYENKRLLSCWLKANEIPHPRTYVFYDQAEISEFVDDIEFPIVAKTSIGASGSGVQILRTKGEADHYINETFSGKGSPQRTGPDFKKGGYLRRGFHYLLHPSDIDQKLNIYNTRAANPQRGFVIFQQYIPHEFEWRVVRIGHSFFAHKKLKKGEKASGSLIKSYDNPPSDVMDFVMNITDRYGFYSQAVDLFATETGYLVNEMQCIFGQSDPYQMMVNGVPGRYVKSDTDWLFEAGDFAVNGCYNLRINFLLTGK